ncbi:alpha/beta fold hydrolase [Ramlibacter humi]|uniref:Alpha/beta hydrolase n=1 Tax=Ramlibacter humi TaxID=2530451 RepID=A0A4Z0BP97_9BURK|nr:alpha/beta hydrolase [Ramlibacter humi]TFZ00254.1 alpha/beta hydrolase [Ramlibacter humi]
MELMEINGVRLEVQRIPAPAGGLAPVVFLHEGLGSVSMWRDWPAQLCTATGRAGIVYSRRGYGRSDPVPDVRGAGRLQPGYMHREAWEVLPALLKALDLQAPVLVGHSDGGSIALLHASRHPLAACVVMAPHVIVEDVSVDSIAQARDAYGTGLRERLAKFHADVDVAFWQWNDAWLNPAFRDFDIRPECRRITAPVLAIQGVDDAYGTLRQIEEIAPTNGPFEMQVLERCGHSPHRDQPEAVTQRIAQFLRGNP